MTAIIQAKSSEKNFYTSHLTDQFANKKELKKKYIIKFSKKQIIQFRTFFNSI